MRRSRDHDKPGERPPRRRPLYSRDRAILDQAVNIAAAKKPFNAGGSFSTYKATVKAETIAHHRRILANCITNAIGPTVVIEALRELGMGGV
jgi:hypothetical protein